MTDAAQAMKNADATEKLDERRREQEVKTLTVVGMVSDFVACMAKFMLNRSNSGPEEEQLKRLISTAIMNYVSANKSPADALNYVAPKIMVEKTVKQSPALIELPRTGGFAIPDKGAISTS